MTDKNQRAHPLVVKRTERGFALAEFTDRYGNECSIQDSSLATEACIWLGIAEPKVQMMARDAARLGLAYPLAPERDPGRLNGWVDFPLPDEVSILARMHLTQAQAKALLPLLRRFIKTGSIAEET